MHSMLNFIAISLISIGIIFLMWLITYEVLRGTWNLLPRMTETPRRYALLIGIPIFSIHIVGIWIYGIAYFLVENYTSIGAIIGHARTPGMHLDSFLDCLYFSAATYTSLGLGDFVPTDDLRMLVGAEVLNGLMTIGWTVTFTYLSMEKFWQLPHAKRGNRNGQ